ncbi:MAG: DUF3696 domain-containing protein [Deltaproteobacteria bacterium]|jgi:predicted ATPase|nr:DUF3696 domain-containing protein [Deltaproteobacteria bacterium]
MINKWTLANFKSVKSETELTFAPLTILTGQNNSGKSTILQSILLISQTLSNKIGSPPIVLNGSLARLGQFSDLRSFGSESDHITIGWEQRAQSLTGFQKNGFFDSNTHQKHFFTNKNNNFTIKCSLSFDADINCPESDLYQLQPQLLEFNMSLYDSNTYNKNTIFKLNVIRNNDSTSKIANIDNKSRISSNYDISLDQILLDEILENFISAELIGCKLRHFQPDKFIIKINLIDEIAYILKKALIGDLRLSSYNYFYDFPISTSVIQQLKDTLHLEKFLWENLTNRLFQNITIGKLIDEINKLSHIKIRNLYRFTCKIDELDKIIFDIVKNEFETNELSCQIEGYCRPPLRFRKAYHYIEEYFSTSVKYLSPLRCETKPLYPIFTHTDPTDIGLKGEMTAAVLNIHRQRNILYIPSASFSQTPFDLTPKSGDLNEAVNDWLNYLGIAKAVVSVDKGKLGSELKISLINGGPSHDLTQAGVGVSQALPILVMSLLADKETTLIFERPELHLHPMVQAKLADFFLSIVFSGKQCLIETHSEYLINRIRYRAAAEDSNNRVIKNLKLYFVENTKGSSFFRQVVVNEYGAILAWPKGFFDQSPDEAESIISAAIAKRKRPRVI